MAISAGRLSWARSWLFDAHDHDTTTDEFQIIDGTDTTSEYGVRSLPDIDVATSVNETSYAPSFADVPFGAPSCNDSLLDVHIPSALLDSLLSERYSVSEDELHDSTISRPHAMNLELAGRRNDGHIFEDFRSAGKARTRFQANSQKYYGYRSVKRGELGLPHYVQPKEFSLPQKLPKDLPVQTMTKKMLFQEAQKYPRPPQYSRRSKTKNYSPWAAKVARRWAAEKHIADKVPADVEDDLSACEIEDIRMQAIEEYNDQMVSYAIEESLKDQSVLDEVNESTAQLFRAVPSELEGSPCPTHPSPHIAEDETAGVG